uniref:hypothetical protein n=1 Tax=Klebsiella michiganensis TaxID=1134687 RepID=UPI001CDAFF1D|nr:hypothetical protein [Klebsiella michiganensis]
MVMKAGDLVSLSFGQLMVSHGVPLCFFGEKKRTRTGSWPLLSYAPWVLQLLSEFASDDIDHYVEMNELYRSSFQSLWDKIYEAGSWASNPLVWVVTFKLLDIDRGENE